MKLTSETRHGVRIFVSECDKNARQAFYRTSSELLKELLANMGVLALKYTEYVQGDAPYIHHERQLDGLIVPALSKICDGAILTECPITRNCNLKDYEKNDAQGRFDYWCMYPKPRKYVRKNSFILEVKHNYDNCTNDVTCIDLVRNWDEMCVSQLQSVRDDAKNFVEETNGVIRIGLQFVTSRCAYKMGAETETIISDYKNNLHEILERLKIGVITSKPKMKTPNFMACWIPPQKHIESVAEGRDKIYPGLIMMGKIFAPIAHIGSQK